MSKSQNVIRHCPGFTPCCNCNIAQWINLTSGAQTMSTRPLLAGSKERMSGSGERDFGPGWTLQQALHGTRWTGSASSLEVRYVKLFNMPTWALSEPLADSAGNQSHRQSIATIQCPHVCSAPLLQDFNRVALSEWFAPSNSVAELSTPQYKQSANIHPDILWHDSPAEVAVKASCDLTCADFWVCMCQGCSAFVG